MGLNSVPNSERVHIGFFGKRNSGKSSLVNAVTNQKLSVVSDIAGTTTDPVKKAMELLPIGPVLIIDTPGFDDEGNLGKLRVDAAKKVLNSVDIAVLVIDITCGKSPEDEELINIFAEKSIPYITVYNKSDLVNCNMQEDSKASGAVSAGNNEITVSAVSGTNIKELKELIGSIHTERNERKLVADIINPGEYIVLVVPIDSAAPKGRLILPQQQTIRDIIDAGAYAVTVKDTGLSEVMSSIGVKPSLIITDSQVFEKVNSIVPGDIPLTSFSILMARYKGFLDIATEGVMKMETLKDGDKVLISEGCTHHRQCDDIGTVKLPAWINEYTGRKLTYEFTSGAGFMENEDKYSLIVHCGGCMLNEREIMRRMKTAADRGIPVTNYGIAIAHMKGILARSMQIFKKI